MSVITARKRKERYETLNKAKFISLISTAVLATASSGVFADETTPVSDGSTSPTVSVTAPVPTDKAPDTSASHVSDGTGVTAPTTPVTPAPPTTPKTEEKPSTSEKVKSKTTASNSQIPDPNKVTDKAPEAKPSTEKQAAATETEALPHTGDDDTALTVSLTSLGAFLIAAGLGFLPKRKKD